MFVQTEFYQPGISKGDPGTHPVQENGNMLFSCALYLEVYLSHCQESLVEEDVVDRMSLFHALQNLISLHVLIRHPTGKCTGTSLLKAQEYLRRQEEQLLKDFLLSNFLACGKKT